MYPASGTIQYNENLSTEIRYNVLRRQIGFVSQDTQLFGGTIKENLLVVKGDATDQQVWDALDKASCAALVSKTAKGIDTVLGEGGMKLSGGEKQRISIARALIRKPRLLILMKPLLPWIPLTEEGITTTIQDVS